MTTIILFLFFVSCLFGCQAAGAMGEVKPGMLKGSGMLGPEAEGPAASTTLLPTEVGPTVRQVVVLPPGSPPDRESLVTEPIFGG